MYTCHLYSKFRNCKCTFLNFFFLYVSIFFYDRDDCGNELFRSTIFSWKCRWKRIKNVETNELSYYVHWSSLKRTKRCKWQFHDSFYVPHIYVIMCRIFMCFQSHFSFWNLNVCLPSTQFYGIFHKKKIF